jgi:hypothetical protein
MSAGEMMTSCRALFQNNPEPKVDLAQKLNEVAFPKYVNGSPFVHRKSMIPNTPITLMMELRNWQQSKIVSTIVDHTICQENIVSNKLLEILEWPAEAQKSNCIEVAHICSSIIAKIMLGLAKKQLQGLANHENFHESVIQLTNLHCNDIRGMIANILEKIFVSHAEQQRVNEVKKLINSTIFLKSVIICACEVQFFIHNVKDMQIFNIIDLVD